MLTSKKIFLVLLLLDILWSLLFSGIIDVVFVREWESEKRRKKIVMREEEDWIKRRNQKSRWQKWSATRIKNHPIYTLLWINQKYNNQARSDCLGSIFFVGVWACIILLYGEQSSSTFKHHHYYHQHHESLRKNKDSMHQIVGIISSFKKTYLYIKVITTTVLLFLMRSRVDQTDE